MAPQHWYLVAGIVLCAMAIAATIIQRVPLSSAIVYLLIGWALGPGVFGFVHLSPIHDAGVIEETAKAIILFSLFSAGLKMRLPFTNRLWFLPLRLAFGSMILTVALIALAGVYLFSLPVGLAILLGGALAPTDPVLASEVEVENPYEIGALRFGLTSEAGLNDGSAFPLVLLGLMLLKHPAHASVLRWVGVDLLWGTFAGIGVGFAVAMLVGNYVLHLRTVHKHAVGLGFFLAPGLIALSYSLGELVRGYGFLSVFACAVTLRWIEIRRSKSTDIPELPLLSAKAEARHEFAVKPETAPVFLIELLLRFTDQLEQIGELVIVVMVGAMLGRRVFVPHDLFWVPLLFLGIRPVAILVGLIGTPLGRVQRGLTAWFGIRGIASLYYLAYALQHGLPRTHATLVADTVLAVIAASIVIHGITVTPLMRWYSRRQPQELASARR